MLGTREPFRDINTTKLETGMLVVALCAGNLLASCTQPGGAPPSAAKPVEASAEGLSQLFQLECIEQQDLTWVRDEIERRRWQSCSGAGNDSDCMLRAAIVIHWNVRTTSNSTVVVSIAPPKLGEVPSPGLARCEIKVPEDLGYVLKAGISRLEIRGHPLAGPLPEKIMSTAGLDQDWIWRPSGVPEGKPYIVLQHFMSLVRYEANLKSRKISDTPGSPEWSSYKNQVEHPWILSYQID